MKFLLHFVSERDRYVSGGKKGVGDGALFELDGVWLAKPSKALEHFHVLHANIEISCICSVDSVEQL